MAYDPKSNPPFPKSRGDTIRSQDWNDAVNEVVRLGTDKVNKAGDTITGSLTVAGNVGIGVTNPQRALSVNSALNVDQANANNGSVNPGITFGSSSGEGIASKRTSGGNQSGLDLYTNNAARLSITNSGNVGVGTTNPQQGRLMIEDAASPLSLRETGQAPTAGGLWRVALDAGVLRFDANTAAAGDFSSYASPVTMNAAGNVGLGTAPQTAKLFVASTTGGITVDSGTTNTVALTLRSSGAGWGSGLQLLNATTNTGRNYGLYAGGDGSLHVADATAGADRLLINNAGNVGIETNNPQAKLHVAGGSIRWGNNSELVTDQGGSLELGGNNSTSGTGTPYIDFHFSGFTQDFNTRIINDANGRLSLIAPTLYATGSVGIGTTGPSRKLHVEGTEIHSGGIGGGFSFGNRETTTFVETPAAGGERWVWYSSGGRARLWSGGDKLSVTPDGNVGIGTAPADRLDVAGNLRILTGSNPIRFTAGWSGFPDVPAATNQAEISNDTGTYKTLMIVGNRSGGLGRRVSVWDRLEVNGTFYTSGNVGIGTANPGTKLDVAGGDIRLEAGRTFSSPGRMHISGEEILFLLNKGGVIVSRAWGGNGNLTADGEVRLGASDAQVHIGGNRSGPFMQLNDDLWFSDPQNGTIWIRNGNDSDWGTMVGRFNPPSSIEYKKDTSVLREPDLALLLDDALRTDVVRYRFKGEDKKTSRLRLGVIVENCPEYLVGEDSKSLSSTEYIAMLHGALKALANRVTMLEKRLIV